MRELAIALGAANVAMPQIAERLERIERWLLEHTPAMPPPAELAPMREKAVSHHDVEEMISSATKSERVREVVKRGALEAGGKLLLRAVGVAAVVFITAACGYVVRDCQARGAPVTAPARP